jgi:hypothetical protein
MTDICNELNKAGFEMPDFKGGGKFELNRLDNSIDLMKSYVTYSASMYDHLNSKGLINRGYCPITGEKIGTSHLYQIFGRKVYISAEGERLAKERDRKLHIETFGKEPMTEQEKREAAQNFLRERENGKKMLIMWGLLIILGIIYFLKKC